MTGTPYIRFFSDDWLAGTQDLSLEERGVLITIVAMTASTGSAPVENYDRLSRRFGCTKGRARKLVLSLIEQGKLTVSEGALLNRRAQKETEIAQKTSEKQSEVANARWKKSGGKTNKNNADNDATALPRHMPERCQPEPEPEPYIDPSLQDVSGASAPAPARKSSSEILDNLGAVLDDERSKAVVAHRKSLKKPLTAHAAKLLASKLGDAPDPNLAADTMIVRGWTGFNTEWNGATDAPNVTRFPADRTNGHDKRTFNQRFDDEFDRILGADPA